MLVYPTQLQLVCPTQLQLECPTQLQLGGTVTQLHVHTAPAGMGSPHGSTKERLPILYWAPLVPGGTVPGEPVGPVGVGEGEVGDGVGVGVLVWEGFGEDGDGEGVGDCFPPLQPAATAVVTAEAAANSTKCRRDSRTSSASISTANISGSCSACWLSGISKGTPFTGWLSL